MNVLFHIIEKITYWHGLQLFLCPVIKDLYKKI